MYIETPIDTPVKVETDETLEHLYTLRELLAGSALWCTGDVCQKEYVFSEHKHCILGLAVLAAGGDPTIAHTPGRGGMGTDEAIDWLQKYSPHMYTLLHKASQNIAQKTGTPSTLEYIYDINDRLGYYSVVRMVDDAIQLRKKEL